WAFRDRRPLRRSENLLRALLYGCLPEAAAVYLRSRRGWDKLGYVYSAFRFTAAPLREPSGWLPLGADGDYHDKRISRSEAGDPGSRNLWGGKPGPHPPRNHCERGSLRDREQGRLRAAVSVRPEQQRWRDGLR